MANEGVQDVRQVEQAPILDPTVDFIAGNVSGMAALCVGYPFDTVKVRFQNPELSHKYRTTFSGLATIVREERVHGLFKGITAPLAGCAFLNGLVFATYGYFTKIQLKHQKDVPTLNQVLLAGAGSGIASTIITTPAELIKIHQQNDLGSSVPSARQTALRIYRNHGIRGLFRGLSATAWRDSGYGFYFWGYEATCRYFSRPATSPTETPLNPTPPQSPSPLIPLAAGAVAGVLGWVVTFPFDLVKTRVQSTFERSPSSPCRTTWSTIVNSYRAEGLPVFFRGLAPTLIRAIPVNMVTFSVFEAVVRTLS